VTGRLKMGVFIVDMRRIWEILPEIRSKVKVVKYI
jgi:hypothetical protein